MNSSRSWVPLVRLTGAESSRQPSLLLLTTTLLLFIGSLPFLITHNLGEPGKLVRDSSLAMMFLGSLILAVPSACHAMGSELQKGTAGSILSKPVGRFRFLLAKFIGISAITLTFGGLCILAILMADRAAAREFTIGWVYILPLYGAILLAYFAGALVNAMTRRSFSATTFWLIPLFLIIAFGLSVMTTPSPVVPPRWEILPVGMVILFASLMIQALALLCALRLPLLPSLTICIGIFLLGLLSDSLFSSQTEAFTWTTPLYLALPNWQHFWMADSLTKGGSLPWSYVGHAAVYAATWTTGILLLAWGNFERMEIR